MMADPIAVALLAGVAWLEGVRQLPPGARLLRQHGRRWELARPTPIAGDYALVSWSVTLAPPVVLTGGDASAARGAQRDAKLLRARRWRVRAPLAATRAATVLLLTLVVLGVPAATARWREWGLLGAVACAFLLSGVVAALVVAALRRLDVPWGQALRAGAPLAWPFSALRAAEVVLAHATRGVADVVVARELMGDAALLAAMRPALYDARHGRPQAGDALLSRDELAAVFEPSAVARYLQAPPAAWEAGSGAYCPRCAAVYVATVARCAECRGVALRGAERAAEPHARAFAEAAAPR